MRFLFLALVAVSLVACSPRGIDDGPDEFGVVPADPLELPPSFTDLPAPTPGGANLADLTPEADVAVALGGGISASGIPATDGAIVSYASRFGTDPNIRADLLAADEQFRARRGRVGFLGLRRGDRYFSAYARQTLDAAAELRRFRNAGVRVPTAPPAR